MIDVRDPLLANRISDIDVLVHLAGDYAVDADPAERRAYNLRAAQTVLTASAAARVRRVVLVTSAMVYGAAPDNPVPLPRTARSPPSPTPAWSATTWRSRRWYAGRCAAIRGWSVTVLRPGRRGRPRRGHASSPATSSRPGCSPSRAASRAGSSATSTTWSRRWSWPRSARSPGWWPWAATGWLEQEQVEELSGLRRLELPAGLTFGTAQRLHRLGITPAPATDLHYVVYPWVVDCAALRAAGWKPPWTNEAAFEQLLELREGRHDGGRPPAVRQGGHAHRAPARPSRSSAPPRSSTPPARSAA